MSPADGDRIAGIFDPPVLSADVAAWERVLSASEIQAEQANFGAVPRHDILAALGAGGPGESAAVLAGFYYRDNNADGRYTPGEALPGSLLGIPAIEGAAGAAVRTYGDSYVAAPLTPGTTVTVVLAVDGIEPIRREITLRPGLNVLHVPVEPTSILVYTVCHSHFDPEWRDTYEGYLRRELPQLIDRVTLLRRDPEHVFQMDEELVVRPLLERHPELREEVRQRVVDGQIEMKGLVTAGELTMPLGESIVRQLTEGQWWASELMGMDVRPVTCWNVDCYGVNYQWPQILALAGRKYFVMGEYSHYGGKKIVLDQLPFSDERVWDHPEFWLEGLDGSKVLVHRSNYGTEPRGPNLFGGDVASHRSVFNFEGGDFVPARLDLPDFLRELNDIQEARKYDGQVDHWGRPVTTRPAGECKFIIATSRQFFRAIENAPDLPTFRTESWMGFWDGCYESHANGRLLSRRIESTLLAAESVAGAAMLAGATYPAAELREAWYQLLINHHHDPQLTVMSPNYLFDEVIDRYEQIAAEADGIASAAAAALAASVRTDAQTGDPVVVFNPLPWARPCFTEWPIDAAGARPVRVVDATGSEVPSQCYRRDDDAVVGFLSPDVPGAGWRVHYVQIGQRPSAETGLIATETLLENPHLRVEIADGLVQRIVDQHSGRPIFEATAAAGVNELFIWEDLGCIAQIRPANFMAEAKLIGRSSIAARTTVVEMSGPAMAGIKTTFQLDRGSFTQTVRLAADARYVDFATVVDWDSKDEGKRRVRVAFPVAIRNPRVWRDVPFAVIPWEPTGDVLPVNSFLGVSDGGQTLGGAVVNPGLPSAQVIDGVLWQTLFRSVRLPGENEDGGNDWPCGWDVTGDRSLMDGRTEYAYRVVSHGGTWSQAGVPRLALGMTVKPLAVPADRHDGTLGGEGGSLDVCPTTIMACAWRKCDYSDATMVRLYNPTDRCVDATLTLGFAAAVAEEIDFREDRLGSLTIHDGRVALTFGPYQIKTVRLVARN